MTIVNLPGSKTILIGAPVWGETSLPANVNTTLDATNEAVIWIGRVETSDGGSHTINTTGSSSIQWRAGAVTFANGGSSFSVGIAPVDTGTGPPGRASNSSDVIAFDVAAVFTGGGAGVTANAWQTSVPTTGTKTIANGDLVAICLQFTTRAGADAIVGVSSSTGAAIFYPSMTTFTGGSYAAATAVPNAVIVFADGALGWIYLSDVSSARTTTNFASGSSPNERGQLFVLPFPCKIYGIYGHIDPDANFDAVLYSDPLGTPFAEKTIAFDANTAPAATGRRFSALFDVPYTYVATTAVAAIVKPGASNVGVYHKTLGNAAHRVTDPWGTSGYGVNRSSGAFADQNSGLDHYYVGLIVGAFDDGTSVSGGGGLNVLGGGGVIS